ncbi:MAG: hypothetical protein AAGA55_05005 [Planctomycetota bacterium]
MLPDPTTEHAFERCLGCDYSLEGIAPGGVCPECATPVPEPGKSVAVCGVARVTETNRGRRSAWIAVCVFGFFYAQVLPFLIFRSPVFSGVLSAALIAAVVGLLLTGTSHKRGKERFILTPRGWSRSTLEGESAGLYAAWPAGVDFEWKRISSVWYRLVIRGRDEKNKRTTLLDAGVRCTDTDFVWLKPMLRSFLTDIAPEPGAEQHGTGGPGADMIEESQER